MTNCTGKRCPVQVGKVAPAICEAYKDCQWATRPMTNADRIRAMTDEELAEWCAQEAECPPTRLLCQEYTCDAGQCWLNWLKQEVQE